MNSAEFHKELTKIMPGYNWTVHKASTPERLTATGIQSSGFNRLSTLQVKRVEDGRGVSYEAKSAGHGTKSPWMHISRDGTLARALRGLQAHYEATANTHRALTAALQRGRTAQETREAPDA